MILKKIKSFFQIQKYNFFLNEKFYFTKKINTTNYELKITNYGDLLVIRNF